MGGRDDRTVRRHRLREGQSESFSRAGRTEDVGAAHVAQYVAVVIEEAEEIDALTVGARLGLGFETVTLGSVADDSQGRIVVLGDVVERVDEEVNVLVFDEPPGEEHVVGGRGNGRTPDLVHVDSVGDDFDVFSSGSDFGEALGSDSGDSDWVLWGARGDVLDEFAAKRESAQVFIPVVTPDLVPGGDERGVRAQRNELRGEDREVGEDRGDDEVVVVSLESFSECGREARGEVDCFRDGAFLFIVEVRFRGDSTECHAFVRGCGRSVPEVTAIDCDIVAAVG